MKTFRIILVLILWVLMIISLFYVDYRNLISRVNLSAGLNLIITIMLTTSLLLSNRYESKHPEKK